MPGTALLHWEVDDLRVTLQPPSGGQAWCLDIDITSAATGQGEAFLWDATSSWNLELRADKIRAATLERLSSCPDDDLVIVTRQGIGDIIQQWRYAPLIIGRRGRVRVECRPELHRLLSRQPLPVAPVTPEQARRRPGQVRVSLMGLDTWFGDSTGGRAYMTAARGSATSAGRDGGRPRIGLNWSSNQRAAAHASRSMPLAFFERLVGDRPDVDWVSVQWGEAERRLADHPWADGVERLGRSFTDVADLAAAIADLDLLITIDSGPAHLAGALGVPVWTLLCRPVAWRWGLDGGTTRLYQSMRLVRQARPGDWTSVAAALSRMLDAGFPVSAGPGSAGQEARRRTRRRRAPLGSVPSFPHPADPPDLRLVPLAEALRQCREPGKLRSAFVLEPLRVLTALGAPMSGRDHDGLARVFEALVDCHGGFPWCTPLAADGARRVLAG